MSEPNILSVTIKGGEHDGEQFEIPADQAGAGDTVPYLDAHYRLIRVSDQEWTARLVTGAV